MTECFTYFYVKGRRRIKTGVMPPQAPTPFIPSLPTAPPPVIPADPDDPIEPPATIPTTPVDGLAWAVVAADGTVSSSRAIELISRSASGVYFVRLDGAKADDKYVISAYADDARPNLRRNSIQPHISNQSRSQFVLSWRDSGTLTDTAFSLTIY